MQVASIRADPIVISNDAGASMYVRELSFYVNGGAFGTFDARGEDAPSSLNAVTLFQQQSRGAAADAAADETELLFVEAKCTVIVATAARDWMLVTVNDFGGLASCGFSAGDTLFATASVVSPAAPKQPAATSAVTAIGLLKVGWVGG